MNATMRERTKPTRDARKVRLLLLLGIQLLLAPSAGSLAEALSASASSASLSSSSYLDDYFSTAKYALSKLQQSLTVGDSQQQQSADHQLSNKSAAQQQQQQQETTTTASFSPETATAAAASKEATSATETSTSGSQQEGREFVRLDTSLGGQDAEQRPALVASLAEASGPTEQQQQQQQQQEIAPGADSTTQIVVTAQTDEQPEETTKVEQPPTTELARPDDAEPSLQVIVQEASGGPAIDDTSSSVKETEMNAVAAVDMSMGFGNELNLFNSDKEPCYDEYGNPRFCEPEFENVAFERQVEVSSECGQPASRFCTTSATGSGQAESQIRNCHICDAQHPKKRHPASYLTDLNNSNNPTCWVSAPIQVEPTSSNNNNNASSGPISNNLRADNVSLVVDLDKRYEILYVSMQFCSLKPDSLAIHKSNDFGHSWQAYQFYSSHCSRLYNRHQQQQQQSSVIGQQQTTGLNNEAGCANVTSSGSSATRVAFSTLEGARVGSSLDKSPALQDWISATNIRITLDRHQAAWIQSTVALHSGRSHLAAATAEGPQQKMASSSSPSSIPIPTATTTTPAIGTMPTPLAAPPQVDNNNNNNSSANNGQQESSQQLTNPSSDTYNYAISDLTIVGRCKCNGHASRCIHARDGRLQCDCRHNTAGRDCERCAPLHADRPWARASPNEANICQACNCNGHSRKCRFDAELYRLSGKRSGGVCLQCKDNTDGRYCHYCKEGFTRDHSKPMSDKEACKPCDCHPVGSLGRVCNQTTGQCPCKEGVTGLLCNRCAPGYQQSSSQSEPCFRIPPEASNEINNELGATETDEQPTINQVPSEEADSPTIGQEQQPALSSSPSPPPSSSQVQQQQQLPAMTGRTPPGGQDPARWPDRDRDLDTGAYWPVSANQLPAGNGLYPIDEADDSDDTGRALIGSDYTRPAAGQQYWPPTGAGRKHSVPPKQTAYYGARYPGAPAAGRRNQLDLNEDELDNLTEPAADNAEPIYRAANYGPANTYSATRQRHPGRYRHYQQHYRQPPLQPMANLNPDSDDQEANIPYAHQQHVYSDESNQIGGRDLPAHHRLRPQPYQRGPTSAQGQARRPPLAKGTSAAPNNNNNNVHSNVNSIISNRCGDCQSNMRRLKSAKFCELEFAIRCSILNKLVAEDWTKLDIEIQDIFKSPMGAGNLEHSLAKAAAAATNSDHLAPLQSSQRVNFVETLMQQDAPVALDSLPASGTVGVTAPTSANKTANADNDIGSPQHRLKVGTVQTIWVPTEDLACKCLRLKRGSTYLLMGTIDANENSANSLQLDRHGVALEWRPSLQAKMLKLQRKYARGSLCA